MPCLLCASQTKDKLCSVCSKLYLYDNDLLVVRRKKHFFHNENKYYKEHLTEYLIYVYLRKVYGQKEVFRQVHPLWALSKKNVLLEYDISIPSKKLLIEYDGEQHFNYPNYFHKTKKEFLDQQERDRLKDKLAKENKWTLIRFSYLDKIDDYHIERKIKSC